MAQSLETIRRLFIQTSIHGRRLFLDFEGFLAGIKGVRNVVTNATSDTTGTQLPNHGLVTVFTTTNDTWQLADPIAGCEVDIVFAELSSATTSTGIATITPENATITSLSTATGGTSTGASLTLTGCGAGAHLMGGSTGVWVVTSVRGSTAQAYVTT